MNATKPHKWEINIDVKLTYWCPSNRVLITYLKFGYFGLNWLVSIWFLKFQSCHVVLEKDSCFKMAARVLFLYKNWLFRHKDFHCKDKMVVRSSYLYNGNSYTGKTASLYWEVPGVIFPANIKIHYDWCIYPLYKDYTRLSWANWFNFRTVDALTSAGHYAA